MNDLEGIIISSKHQIKNVDYLEFCHDSLKNNSDLKSCVKEPIFKSEVGVAKCFQSVFFVVGMF